MRTSASIVITTRNIAPLLARCVAGLNTQDYTGKNIEVIVADDGSTDDWRGALAELHPKFSRVLISQDHHGFRLATLKNKAMVAARGEIIVFLDGDMIPPPNWLNAHIETVCEEPNSIISIGARRFIDASSITPRQIVDDPHALYCLPEIRSISNYLLMHDRRLNELKRLEKHPAPFHLMHGCNCAFPRSLALAAGPMDVSFDGGWGYEDTEFAHRLWRCGGQFRWSTLATAFHQENSVLGLDERNAGDSRNYQLACERIPEFRAFKERLNSNERTPWW